MKVVFHLSELEKWSMAQGNIKNLLAIDATIEVVLLVNGPAIKGYFATEQAPFIEDTNVKLWACRNALRSNHLDETALSKKITVVPAGVYALVELQTQGYSYIKV
ncbi:MAG: sulfur reduction protein DsrE [Enterococcus sp.]|nr:sulfur reduction protein DsrE [Enterococcus sp.]